MIKGLLPILMTSAGVATVGVASYFVFSEPETQTQTQKAPEIVSEEPAPNVEEGVEETAKLVVPEIESPETKAPEVKIPETEAPTAEQAAVLPSFSVLRVEPDGSGVIAGQGEPSQRLQLFDGEILIAETETGPTGDFAIVLDKPLAPGLHQLTLRTLGPDGEVLVSEEAGLVDVPLPENPSALTVLVTEPGEATRVLAKPIAPEPEVPEPVVPEIAAVTSTDTPEIKPEEPAKPVKPVVIGAVETEDRKLFIAGEAEPGSRVNLYMGSDFLGQAQVSENGAFLFETEREIKAGEFEIRADMMLEPNADVVSRAAVDVLHEPQVAVAEPEVKEVPEEVAAAKPEPVQPEEVASVEETPEADDAQPETKPQLRTGASVIIRRGDSLWQVARRNYGAGIRFTTIFEANRDQVRDPNLIYPGQILKVPDETSDG